jgi:cytochrome c oxidase cbb3-type subunit III
MKNTYSIKKPISSLAAIVLPIAGFSEGPAQQATGGANPFLWFLVIIIILLAFVISALGGAVKNLVTAKNNSGEQKQNGSAKKIAGLLLLLGITQFSNAQPQQVFSGQESIGGISFGVFYFLIAIIAAELIFIFTLVGVMKNLLPPVIRTAKVKEKKTVSILEKLNASVDIEKEESILMEHEYDGIRELDNDLPPWWKYGFYLTVIVACFYMVHYHVTKTGDLQEAELVKATEKANLEIAEYLKQSAGNVDESTVKFLNDKADLGAGEEIFLNTCSACHGRRGEGGVGPNFADSYWMHGGSMRDIFKSIKYGWPEKGMKSWKEELSPMQIAQVSSYIKTLNGTNPPNQKEKQGDLYVEEKTGADSLKVLTTDSLIPIDSLAKEEKLMK